MFDSNAFNYINLLDKAADACWKRNQVIANNIANVDTPGYKRKDVQFESYLSSALNGNGSLDERVANLSLDSLDPTIYTDNSSLSYRMDGNNVDIDTESNYQAQNQIKFNSLLDSMTQEFNRLKTVLTAK